MKVLKQNNVPGESSIVGDFNAVKSVEERKGRNGAGLSQEIIDLTTSLWIWSLVMNLWLVKNSLGFAMMVYQ